MGVAIESKWLRSARTAVRSRQVDIAQVDSRDWTIFISYGLYRPKRHQFYDI
jgi:hypothetical protein